MGHDRETLRSASRLRKRSRGARWWNRGSRDKEMRLLMLLGWMCVLLGCRQTPEPHTFKPAFTYYQSPNMSPPIVRRVLVMPADNLSDHPFAGERFVELLQTELAAAGLFELVTARHTGPLPPAVLACRNGRFPETVLLELQQRYGVDGVLFTTLTDFHPYWPPRITATVHVVDIRTGETLASVDGSWDARNDNVGAQAARYFSRLNDQHALDVDIMQQSPAYFGKFVAHQITQALGRPWCPGELAVATSSAPAVCASATDLPQNHGPQTMGGAAPDAVPAAGIEELPAPIVPSASRNLPPTATANFSSTGR